MNIANLLSCRVGQSTARMSWRRLSASLRGRGVRVALAMIVGATATIGLASCSVDDVAAQATTADAQSTSAPRGAPNATPSPGSVLPVPENLPLIAEGQRLALVVVEGSDTQVQDAVATAAAQHGARLQVAEAAASSAVADLLGAAEDADVLLVAEADLLVSVDAVSSQLLDTQFLVIGAQLPEPTGNVTAVVWPGADARTAGQPASADLVERIPGAFNAGLAMIGDGGAGMVYELAS